jgi:hypothetical protein
MRQEDRLEQSRAVMKVVRIVVVAVVLAVLAGAVALYWYYRPTIEWSGRSDP